MATTQQQITTRLTDAALNFYNAGKLIGLRGSGYGGINFTAKDIGDNFTDSKGNLLHGKCTDGRPHHRFTACADAVAGSPAS